MASTYTIPKLASSNYDQWSKDIKYLLMERQVWTIVNGTEKAPTAADKPKEVSDFRARENVALSLIYLNIDPLYRKIVEQVDDPVTAWTILKQYYQPDSRAYEMELYSQLCSVRILPEETVSLFSARVARLGDQLRSLDDKFPERYICYQFLRFLPEQFDSIVQSILRWDISRFTYKNVTQEVIAEDVRIRLRDKDKTESVHAHTVQRSSNINVVCYACKQRGHYRNRCPNRVFKQEPAPSFPSSSRTRRGRSSSRRRSSRDVSPVSRDKESKPDKSYPSKVKPVTKRSGKDGSRSASPGRASSNCKSFFISHACVGEACASNSWVFDTAASHHFCRERCAFSIFIPVHNEQMHVAVDDATFPIEGKGTVLLKIDRKLIELKDVMYSPRLKRNLISGPKLIKAGGEFYGVGGKVKVSLNRDDPLFIANLSNGLFTVSPKVIDEQQNEIVIAAPVAVEEELGLWHRRLAHISPSVLASTSRVQGAVGMPVFKRPDVNLSCEACKINKFKRVSFKPLNYVRSKAPLELLYADVWGPCSVTGQQGERFFLSIIDDFSRKVSLFPMVSKSEVPNIVKRHITRVENFLDLRVKAFRTDNGREFVNKSLDDFLEGKGIHHELTNIYTPEQNGVPERFNQTVVNGARTILSESALPISFWPEAMLYFSYTWNRVCHAKQVKTPFELFGGTKPSVNHLKPFGTLAYVGIPRQRRAKLDAKAEVGFLVGYAFKTKGYRIWIQETGQIKETINVSFNEDKLYKNSASGAVLGSDKSLTEFQFPTCDYPMSEVIVEEHPTFDEPPESREASTSQDQVLEDSEDRDSDDDGDNLGLREATWYRLPKLRSDRSRTDIYYYEQGRYNRLRSHEDVKKYCATNGIIFKPNLFDFSGKNNYKGIVRQISESSDSEEEGASANLNTTR